MFPREWLVSYCCKNPHSPARYSLVTSPVSGSLWLCIHVRNAYILCSYDIFYSTLFFLRFFCVNFFLFFICVTISQFFFLCYDHYSRDLQGICDGFAREFTPAKIRSVQKNMYHQLIRLFATELQLPFSFWEIIYPLQKLSTHKNMCITNLYVYLRENYNERQWQANVSKNPRNIVTNLRGNIQSQICVGFASVSRFPSKNTRKFAMKNFPRNFASDLQEKYFASHNARSSITILRGIYLLTSLPCNWRVFL